MANSIAIGVAYKDQEIVGGTLDNTPIGATTAAAATVTNLTATGDCALGNAASDKVGFHGATAVVQANAIAAISTSAGHTGAVGFTATQAAAIIANLNSIRLVLKNLGLTA